MPKSRANREQEHLSYEVIDNFSIPPVGEIVGSVGRQAEKLATNPIGFVEDFIRKGEDIRNDALEGVGKGVRKGVKHVGSAIKKRYSGGAGNRGF